VLDHDRVAQALQAEGPLEIVDQPVAQPVALARPVDPRGQIRDGKQDAQRISARPRHGGLGPAGRVDVGREGLGEPTTAGDVADELTVAAAYEERVVE